MRYVAQPEPKISCDLVLVKQVQPINNREQWAFPKRLLSVGKWVKGVFMLIMSLVIVAGLYLHTHKGQLPWEQRGISKRSGTRTLPHDARWLGSWEDSNMKLILTISDKVEGEFVMRQHGIERGFVSSSVEWNENSVLLTVYEFDIMADYRGYSRYGTTCQYLLLLTEKEGLLFFLPVNEQFTLTPAHISGNRKAVYPGNVQQAYKPVAKLQHR